MFSVAGRIAVKEGENIVWNQIAKAIVCYVKELEFHPHWRASNILKQIMLDFYFGWQHGTWKLLFWSYCSQ